MFTNSYLNVIVSSAVVYIFISVAFRVFGKKELAQLSVLDIVFVLLISNAVQNAMVGSDTSLLGGLVAACTLFVLNYLFKYLLYRFKGFSRLVEGEPVILIVEGKVKDRNLRKMEISFDELVEAVHEHGVQSVRDVDLAILEVDGNISIMSNDYKKRSVNKIVKKKKYGRLHYR
jgi:uncharacterized membrane protein YcaP (DUF421 family)